MRELLAKAWQRPLIVCLSLWLGFFGGSWATWLDGQVSRLPESYGTLAATL